MTALDHPEWLALVAAICREPDDDTPRLVAADWLDEHDGEVPCPRCKGRGLVRLGIEKKGGPHDDDRFKRHVMKPHRGTFDWGCDGCGGRAAEPGTGTVSNGFAERAEFVRVQVELAKHGEPHREFEVNTDHFAFHKARVSAVLVQNPTDKPLMVGERIDVTLCDLPAESKRRRRFDGLLVTDTRRSAILRGRVVETSVELLMDEQSVPWAGVELRRRERELWTKRLPDGYVQGYHWFTAPLGISTTLEPFVDGGSLGPKTPLGTVRRGFVSALTCTAAAWIAHADALVWHEGQTVECPECLGDGWYEAPTNSTAAGTTIVCKLCKTPTSGVYGSGRVSRPFPPTAQPITEVRLTDSPPEVIYHPGHNGVWGRVTIPGDGTFTSDKWKSITFHLPERT